MQTVLVELKNKKAFEELQDLEERQMIRIINEADPAFSLALPGDPVSVEDFRKWIRGKWLAFLTVCKYRNQN